MTTITLTLPDDFPVQALVTMATASGCRITHEGGTHFKMVQERPRTMRTVGGKVINAPDDTPWFSGRGIPTEPGAA